MTKKSRSYTVAFGDLEISVSTASVDTSEDIVHVPKPSVKKDEALTRALEHARKKESMKRVIKNDDYFDSLHAGTPTTTSADTINKETKKPHVVKPAKVISRIRSASIVQPVDVPVKDEVPWLHTIPDSVRCIVENAGIHAGKSDSLGTWSDQHDTTSAKTDIHDYFGGLQNVEADVCCWNCGETMSIGHYRQFPKFLPYKHQASSSYFMIRGYYCSWECVKLHAMESGSSNLFNLLALLLSSLYQKLINIRPLCTKFQLEKYGGKYSRGEFEMNMHECNNIRITHKLDWHPTIQNCIRILDMRKKKARLG